MSILNAYVIPGIRKIKVVIPIEDISQFIIGRFFKYTLEELRGKSRKQPVRQERQLLSYLLCRYGFKQRKVAFFLIHNHATVGHSCKTVINDMVTDKELKERVIEIRCRIAEKFKCHEPISIRQQNKGTQGYDQL